MPPQLLDEFGVLVCLFSSLMAGGSGLSRHRHPWFLILTPMNFAQLQLVLVGTVIAAAFLIAGAAETHMETMCVKYQPINSCTRQ